MKLIPAHALMHEKGPCDLRSIRGVDATACGSQDQPRWALGSGESCEVRCSWGQYPQGMPRSSSLVTCNYGQLSQPDFSCAPMACSAPQVAHVASPGCEEGMQATIGAIQSSGCVIMFTDCLQHKPTSRTGPSRLKRRAGRVLFRERLWCSGAMYRVPVVPSPLDGRGAQGVAYLDGGTSA
ncbi:unnamed protein product [Effrenium voratum]|uniref:Uncharacterized protein n=1 Tax=Effrenium voratum TaxID=2562239 RepID=A0AA36NE91_9DINO|nr:unnamed protein product [Effrenium voratum]